MLLDASRSVNDFLSFANSCGYQIPEFHADGKIHRFKCGKRKNGWYVAWWAYSKRFDRSFLVAEVGDWKTGQKYKYRDELTEKDKVLRNEIRECIALEVAQQREDTENKQAAAAKLGREMWRKAHEPHDHPYLNKKQIYSCGVKQLENKLIVPTYLNDKISGAQTIDETGFKLFISGQKFKGSSFAIGELMLGPVYICEGFATGASIHMATGQPVICAFAAGNLLEVAADWSHHEIVIAGDNDKWSAGNAGATRAKEAAKAFGIPFILPRFKDESTKPTDFNDLHVLEGLETVKEQLNG